MATASGDAVDVEALKATEAAPEENVEEFQQAVGVGVLGWLGFIIVNLAAWGFITFASFVSWTFGLGVCILYTVLLVGLAFWLERRGSVYKQFVNLLWVLAGWFLFISGAYIAVNALNEQGFMGGSRNVNYPVYPPDFDQDLAALVPANASVGLQQWAAERWSSNNGPSFTTFGGSVFFNGRTGDESADTLRYTDGSGVTEVSSQIAYATNFRIVGTNLYFLSGQRRLYRVASSNLSNAESIAIQGGFWQDLYVESSAPQLYLKGNLNCMTSCADGVDARSSVMSVFMLDESSGSSDATDLRGDSCALWAEQVSCPMGGGSSVIPGPSRESLWGVIFLAAVPMLILSFYVLLRKQMPGMVFNIFGGVQAIVMMAYFLISYENPGAGFMDFMKWFMLIYTSVLWKVLVNWSLMVPQAAPWLEEVKTWSAAVVGTAFFITIHFVLQVPFTTEVWRWVVYTLLALLQMVMSAVVQRTLPMVMGALAAFVVAWKIGFEVSSALNFGSREVQYLTTFAIIGLEGVGIILAAIAFARHRQKVQDWVRGLLCCAPCRKW